MGMSRLERLTERLKSDFSAFPAVSDAIWNQHSAAKIVDCVLSLRMNYAKVVLPRVEEFIEKHPRVRSCASLVELIGLHESPELFLLEELRIRHKTKGLALLRVAEFLIEEQTRFSGADEAERLAAWAKWARPGDYLALESPGFKLAGFQYLRMLFGAETVKPDVHILRYVRTAIGEEIGEGPVVYLLEQAASKLGVSARSVDVAIWHRGAKDGGK
jgi:hypothetical protein